MAARLHTLPNKATLQNFHFIFFFFFFFLFFLFFFIFKIPFLFVFILIIYGVISSHPHRPCPLSKSGHVPSNLNKLTDAAVLSVLTFLLNYFFIFVGV